MAYQGLKGGGGGLVGPAPATGGGGLGWDSLKPLSIPANFAWTLGTDVADAVSGLPGGVYHLATTNPVQSAKELWEFEKNQWTEVFKSKGKSLYEHPLGPLLDIATVLTLGAGASVKGAQIVSTAGKGATAAKAGAYAAKYTDQARGFKVHDLSDKRRLSIEKSLPTNPLTSKRKEVFHDFAESLATRGGRWGTFAQMGYERARVAQWAGSAAAVQNLLGRVAKESGVVWEKGNSHQRVQYMQDVVTDNRNTLLYHAERQGMKATPEEILNGSVNMDIYAMIGSKKGLFKGMGKDMTREQFVHKLDSMGKYLETDDIRKAATDADGNILLMNRQTAHARGAEAANTFRMVENSILGQALSQGTTLWKVALLGFSPRYFVNNLVGNSIMYSLNQAGSAGMFGV